ncbi:MAG: hypothetical protein R3176_00350 [Woeseiaceae bacterium]|nr:hypothetical protein [Woeseiaceae bacterium]
MPERPSRAVATGARYAGRIALGILLVASSPCLLAEAGDASLRFEYQYIRTGKFDMSVGQLDIGNTDAHVYMLSGSYALTDRLTAFASLPWIQKRHTGALPHNARVDFQEFEPPDLRVVDDGSYHGGWQDLYVGLQYLVRDKRLKLSPFISYGRPVNDYPFYGHAAIGRNLWHVPVGLAWSFTPYFDDWYLEGDVAYIFTEKTLGHNVSHWLVNFRAGYFVHPRFAPKLFVSVKHGTKGLDWPDDFDLANLDSAEFYYHDRTIKHNWVNAGVGFDFIVTDRYQVTGTWFKMVDPEQVNIVDRAWTLGVTRFFSRGRD